MTCVAVALGAILLAGCDALDGDAAAGPVDGLFDGDVVASAFEGEVAVTVDEFATLVTYADGDAYADLTSADPVWEDARTRQRQVLSVLLIQEVFGHAAAEDFGIEITDEQIDARVEERIAEAGGQEQYEAELAADQVTVDLARVQTGWQLLAEQVQEALADGGTPDPDAFQAWQLDTIGEASPVVDSRFGTWNPTSFSVEPDAGPGV